MASTVRVQGQRQSGHAELRLVIMLCCLVCCSISIFRRKVYKPSFALEWRISNVPVAGHLYLEVTDI